MDYLACTVPAKDKYRKKCLQRCLHFLKKLLLCAECQVQQSYRLARHELAREDHLPSWSPSSEIEAGRRHNSAKTEDGDHGSSWGTKQTKRRRVRRVCKFVLDVFLPRMARTSDPAFVLFEDWLEVNMDTDESPRTPTLPLLPPQTPPSPPLSPPGSPLQVLTQSLACIGARQHEGDGHNVNDVYAELQSRMETIKKQEQVLQCEIGDIKERFLVLLKSCGVEDVPQPSHTLTNSDLPDLNGSGMSTPRSTQPRRVSNRLRTPDNMRCMYADLLIEQLLAQASSLTDSSDFSNSPPEQENSKASSFDDHMPEASLDAAAAAGVNVNANTPKDFGKDKEIHSNYQVPPDYHQTPRRRIGLSATNIRVNSNVTLASDVLTTSSNSLQGSASSDVYPASSEHSSENQVVPDLESELVSRMHYYSDFTIDRQRKIDEATVVIDANDENVPPPSSDHSSEGMSQRCVEGSEATHHVLFHLPQTKAFNTPKTPVSFSTSVKSRHSSRSKRGRISSTDSCESDISSGTGSMPRSSYSSYDRLGRAFSRDASSSSRERTSSSRGSRCSSHPLASSTLISDPSSNTGRGSLESGSVYTWSIEDSSDCENLEQSYLRSKGRRQRLHHTDRLKRRSRNGSAASRSSRSHKSGSRPTTSVGADSPPQQPNASLHLTAMMSVIEAPTQNQLAGAYVNSMQVAGLTALRSNSLPRTSTRLNIFSPAGSEQSAGQKSSSAPELSNPTYPDLNMAVSAIGPSNLSSELQQTVTDRSSSPLRERLELPGKSSTSGSTGSSNCQTCHPTRVVSADATPQQSVTNELLDSILTDSPHSYDSSGVHPPYNSYTSPAGSNTGYSTVSSWSSESNQNGSHLPTAPPPTPPTVKPDADSVFKMPRSPMWSVKRRLVVNGHSAQNSGVRTVTPRAGAAVVSLNGADPLMRRKLFTVAQNNGAYNPPKVLDKKALVKKFKKFSTNFYKKDRIKTLANL